MKLIGAHDRPGVLLVTGGEERTIEYFNRISDSIQQILGGTVRVVSYIGEVDPSEWDAVVTRTFNEHSPLPARYNCIFWPHKEYKGFIDRITVPTTNYVVSASHVQVKSAEKNIVLTQGTPRTDTLIEEIEKTRQSLGRVTSYSSWSRKNPLDPREARGEGILIDPFILSKGCINLGWYNRSENSQALLLPPESFNIVDWVAWVARRWNSKNPKLWASSPGWESLPQWRTRAEVVLLREIDEVVSARNAFVEGSILKEMEIRDRLAAVSALADLNDRSILKSDGDRLVDAVISLFIEVGFEVINSDKVLLKPNQSKAEDLRVFDPEDPEWVALVEVKGNSKGAKGNDLDRQLPRADERFYGEQDRYAPAKWFVSNHNTLMDPDHRPIVLQGADKDIDTFTRDGGLVIDSRHLYELRERWRREDITKSEARSLLKYSTGRLSLPSLKTVNEESRQG